MKLLDKIQIRFAHFCHFEPRQKRGREKVFLRLQLNNRGAVLIFVYMVLFVLMALSSSIALFNFTELNDARRYENTTKAFWLAEAGINEFLADTSLLDGVKAKTIVYDEGTVELREDDSSSRYRIVTSAGIVRGCQKRIQIRYPALSTIFENTVSTKGNFLIEGHKSSLMVNDKLRVGGQIINTAVYPLVFFEDKKEGLNDGLVSIAYPDANHNGVANEFSDFVAFNRQLIATYPKDEVVYVQGNETYTITPDDSLKGKKIIYIEGNREGEGNAIIQFTGALEKGQNLTVIATGTVTNNLAGLAKDGAQLNIIAWSDYFETTALPSVQNGLIYTHASAYFDEIHDTSVTNGSIVANNGVVIREIWSTKTFNYADMRKNGIVPPGFEGLAGSGIVKYTAKPSSWKEI